MHKRAKREDHLPALRAARDQGKSLPQIAAEHGLAYATVWAWLRNYRPDAPDSPPSEEPSPVDVTGLSPLDAAVLRDGNTWAGRAAIAKDFAVPMGVVESRFHRLRGASHRVPAVTAAPPAPRPVPVPVSKVETFNWTSDRITEAQDLQRAGVSPADIAALFGVSPKAARPVMVDLIDGDAVYVDEIPREKDDFYPTPPEPTRALMNVEAARLSDFPAIWEPACGDGAMARDMRSAGHLVLCSDLVDRGCDAICAIHPPAIIQSFYDFQVPLARAAITNPPFQECNSGAWIRHALGVLRLDYMALLLPIGFPGAQSRAALWDQFPPARVYLMRWRIDFTGAGAPPMLNAWFVWDGSTRPEDTRFLMLSRKDAEPKGFDL